VTTKRETILAAIRTTLTGTTGVGCADCAAAIELSTLMTKYHLDGTYLLALPQ
jgi:hypothetical protein